MDDRSNRPEAPEAEPRLGPSRSPGARGTLRARPEASRAAGLIAAYPMAFRPEPDGMVHVYARDLPALVTAGADEAAAAAQAEDGLGAVIEMLIARGGPVPPPSRKRAGERLVRPPAETAAKLLVWRAWRGSELSKVAFAERLGLGENEVRRILDPRHGSRLSKLDAAARALGLRLTIGLEEI